MLKSNSNSSIDEFSDFQKQVICGILLGDASLQYFSRASRTPALTTVHSEAQKDYSQHLASLLGGICKSRNRKEDPRTGKVYKSYDVRTPGNKYFLDIYSNIYDLNKKKVPTVEFLENFTEVSLAYWFMDDGYISRNVFFLCTDSFTHEVCVLLINTLETKLGLHFRINKRDNNFRLRLRNADRKKFIRLISPYLLDCMKYKINVTVDLEEEVDSDHFDFSAGVRMTLNSFISRSKALHGEDRYDYSRVNDIVNANTKVTIICHKVDENGIEHGEFLQTPENHLKCKEACPICYGESTMIYNILKHKKK